MMQPMKQGISAILPSDNFEKTCKSSIRRTLSADMSSKKWLEQNGFLSSPLKKIVSSEVLVQLPGDYSSSSSSSSDGEEYDCDKNAPQDEVWRSIQAEKERNTNAQMPKMESWASILSHQRSENMDSALLPPPYVHPLVKRSASTLSEKSLEICTESLGSETGSDCFCSPEMVDDNLSDDDDSDHEDGNRVVVDVLEEMNSFEDLSVAKYKNSPARPFPPPLPSIAGGGDGVSLHMKSRRENGRLVLEAVCVPVKNYFQAQRCDGRLVLTLVRAPPAAAEENGVEEFEKVFEMDDDVGGDDDKGYEEDSAAEEQEEAVVVEKDLRSVHSGIMSVHKTGLMMKKIMAIGNKNPATWANKFNKSVAADEVAAAEGDEEELQIPQSLPPPPRVGRLIPSAPPLAASSFNAYEYFWGNKSASCGGAGGGFKNPVITAATPQSTNLKHSNNNVHGGSKVYENNQDLVQFVPYLRGCRQPRRSLLIWEPYCIATS